MVYTYNTPEKGQKGKTGTKKKRIRNEMKRKERKNETKISMHTGRRPSPEGTINGLLFAGTISPIICPGEDPQKDDTRPDGRQDKKRK